MSKKWSLISWTDKMANKWPAEAWQDCWTEVANKIGAEEATDVFEFLTSKGINDPFAIAALAESFDPPRYRPTNFEDVGHFHAKFNLDNTLTRGAGPRPARKIKEFKEFRIKFLEEELEELKVAWENMNEAEMFDALLDLVYVAMGTAHLLGYPWQVGWEAVQKANMAKVRGTKETSKRDSDFDVVKPEGWTPPDIGAILVKYGWGNYSSNIPF